MCPYEICIYIIYIYDCIYLYSVIFIGQLPPETKLCYEYLSISPSVSSEPIELFRE
jgi:hypothetical protein